jgi:hypothetical protein
MKRRVISLAALIGFCVSIPISEPAMGQTGKSVSARRVSTKPNRAATPRRNLRAARATTNAASINMATLLLNDTVSVGPVHADSRSKTFYWPDCPKFDKIPLRNRQVFGNDEDAEQAGYKPARDCKR